MCNKIVLKMLPLCIQMHHIDRISHKYSTGELLLSRFLGTQISSKLLYATFSVKLVLKIINLTQFCWIKTYTHTTAYIHLILALLLLSYFMSSKVVQEISQREKRFPEVKSQKGIA